jgi:hypothetical protein
VLAKEVFYLLDYSRHLAELKVSTKWELVTATTRKSDVSRKLKTWAAMTIRSNVYCIPWSSETTNFGRLRTGISDGSRDDFAPRP